MPIEKKQQYKLKDLIDIRQFQDLQDRLNEIYTFPSAIIDTEGNVLTATAWQDVCIKFHRINESSKQECIKSDTNIKAHLHDPNPTVAFKCPHGLVDTATPIIIDGIHYANFFTGQFFLEKPDFDQFRRRAKKYGFDEDEYIAAVKKVPIWTLDQLKNYLAFTKGIITILSESGLKNLRDIEARKQIQESEKRYRDLFEKGNEGLLIMTLEGVPIEVNEAFARMHGYTIEKIKKISITDLDVSGEDAIKSRKDILSRTFSGETARFEAQHYHKDGHVFPVNVSASIIEIDGEQFFFAFHQDITERKRIEETLQKTQKLEALGTLAGGIAHDFNNLLGAIFGNIDLANDEFDNPKAARYLSRALNSIERARDLTQQLLTFAKGGVPIRKVESLLPFVQETARFALSGSRVLCLFDLPKDLWNCNFDRNQIGQVIDNLVINAQQAMPNGGKIDVSAQNISLIERQHTILSPGNYVKLSIKDQGVGIPKDFLPCIFDPFYTTKAKGHGLGLSTCYSIVNRHGGCIEVESEPGKGSTFHVYLPACVDCISDVEKEENVKFKGSGTFLVMDDEELMRDAIGDMLESLGYTVVLKEKGEDVIDWFTEEIKAERTLAGMIFDLTIPGGMGGKETIGEIRKLCLKIPVFVASGYAEDPVMSNPKDYGFTSSICKPFRKKELIKMLKENIQPIKC